MSGYGMDMDMDCLNREYEVQRFYTTGLLFFLYIYLFIIIIIFFSGTVVITERWNNK